jgi:hypothetical protein
MRTIILLGLPVLLFMLSVSLWAKNKSVTRQDYFDAAKTAADHFWKNYDATVKAWVDQINLKYVFGYAPPGNIIDLAHVSSWIYKFTGDVEYAQRAKKCLVEIGDFRKYYPKDFWKDKPGYENGPPALANFFSVPMYIKAYRNIQDLDILSAKDHQIIQQNIAETCDHQVRNQEWGAMNRGILRAEVFYLAAITVPEAPNAATWKMLAKAIIDDCLGTWEIEDASHYNAIYLYSLFSLVEYLDENDYWNEAVTRYTAQFYTRLMAPHGIVPDFGDAHLYSNWLHWLAIFEKAATIYQDPEMKYAANRIHETLWKADLPEKSMWAGTIAIDCFRWADDKIVPKEPPRRSELVLDDLVGKKVVFRDGYEPKDTYLLVNYKDEGDAGFMSREYLRQTIVVEEEKMTHGHSDENDISLFMTDGCLLLHDGGYRDLMPSGPFGSWRADYFHNKVVVRKDKISRGQKQGEWRYSTEDQTPVPGQNIYDFVRNSGAFRQVRTHLIDFLITDEFDYSRTRVIDPKMRYEYDRIVTWVKPLNIFVVFDVVQFQEADYFTTVNFWHTRKILSSGPNFFDTQYDSIRNFTFPTHKSLLIYFPEGDQGGRMIGSDPENRYFQDEFALHQSLSRWHHAGGLATFTTILIPHDTADTDLQKFMNQIQLVETNKYPQSVGVKIKASDKTYYVCSKLDLTLGLHFNDVRPQYDYELSKVNYDAFETDAQQLFATVSGKSVKYTSIYCTKIAYQKKMLFEPEPIPFGLRFDGKPDLPGVGKVRYWQGEVKIK